MRGSSSSAITGAALYPANQTINGWYNAAAFVTPAAYTFGNAGRDILRGLPFNVIAEFLVELLLHQVAAEQGPESQRHRVDPVLDAHRSGLPTL